MCYHTLCPMPLQIRFGIDSQKISLLGDTRYPCTGVGAKGCDLEKKFLEIGQGEGGGWGGGIFPKNFVFTALVIVDSTYTKIWMRDARSLPSPRGVQ